MSRLINNIENLVTVAIKGAWEPATPQLPISRSTIHIFTRKLFRDRADRLYIY